MKFQVLLGATMACLCNAAFAADSPDTSLITPFPGSELLKREVLRADHYDLLVRNLDEASPRTFKSVGGQITRLAYASPPGAKLSDVYHHYEDHLQKQGFEILYNCAGQSCSPKSAGRDFNARMTPPDLSSQMLHKEGGQRYFAAESSTAQADTYVALYAVREAPLAQDDGKRVYCNVVIIEAAPRKPAQPLPPAPPGTYAPPPK